MTDEAKDGKDIEEIADAWAAVCIDIAEKLDQQKASNADQQTPQVATPEPQDGE
jgi:hypothetical protein